MYSRLPTQGDWKNIYIILYTKNSNGSVGVFNSYYASICGYKGELLVAALWLYKATDKEAYFNYVIEKAHCFGGIGWSINVFSWDVNYVGVHINKKNEIVALLHSCTKVSLRLTNEEKRGYVDQFADVVYIFLLFRKIKPITFCYGFSSSKALFL